MNTDRRDVDDHRPDADIDGEGRLDFSWRRVALAVVLVVAAVVTPMAHFDAGTLAPDAPYADGTITIGGRSIDASVCESVQNGIELHYGEQDSVAYVRHVGPSEGYEGDPPAPPGSYIVWPTDSGERWSRLATYVEAGEHEWVIEATFDDVGPVVVRYDRGSRGWCG